MAIDNNVWTIYVIVISFQMKSSFFLRLHIEFSFGFDPTIVTEFYYVQFQCCIWKQHIALAHLIQSNRNVYVLWFWHKMDQFVQNVKIHTTLDV